MHKYDEPNHVEPMIWLVFIFSKKYLQIYMSKEKRSYHMLTFTKFFTVSANLSALYFACQTRGLKR